MSKEIENDLKILNDELNELKKYFNNRINSLDLDLKPLHNKLIEMSTKYPEYKELIEFILFINDRIETNQLNLKYVMSDTFNEMIKFKEHLINKQNLLKKEKPIIHKIVDNFNPTHLLIAIVIMFIFVMGAVSNNTNSILSNFLETGVKVISKKELIVEENE